MQAVFQSPKLLKRFEVGKRSEKLKINENHWNFPEH